MPTVAASMGGIVPAYDPADTRVGANNGDGEGVALLFGRQESAESFALDWASPLSPFQAFAIALTAFNF